MPDRQYVAPFGDKAVPADWVLPAALEFMPKLAYASFNGAAAGGSFKPCLRLISDSGHVAAEAVADTIVAAGASADVTWFPAVSQQITGSSVLPIQPAFSVNTIVPLAVITGVRATQPSPASFGVAAVHIGYRTVITVTGTLHDLAVYVGAAVAGSIEVAILSTDTPTRRIIYKSGFVNVTANHSWQIIADPALPVQLGEQYDIVYCSSTAQPVLWFGGLVGSGATDAASGTLPTGFVPAPLGAPPKLTWQDTTSPRPYGATTTVAEASLTPQTGVPFVLGRIV